MAGWFTPENKLMEMVIKQAIAQHVEGYLDPRDAGGAYDCTILVPHTYEVKHDKEATRTGNLYFETRNTYRNAPSGIATTRADAWAHYIPCRACIALFSPTTMLAFLEAQIAKHTLGVRRTMPHGGDNNSQGIIAPIALILAQPFVGCCPFTLALPSPLPQLSGVIARCPHCQKKKAIEYFHGPNHGLCDDCAPQPEPQEMTHAS